MPQAVLLGGDGVGDFVAELCGDHHIVRGRDVLQQHPIVVVVLNKIPNVSTWTQRKLGVSKWVTQFNCVSNSVQVQLNIETFYSPAKFKV